MPVDFYEVISNTCNDIIQASEEKMAAIISKREKEITAKGRDPEPQKCPQWERPQWELYFGD